MDRDIVTSLSVRYSVANRSEVQDVLEEEVGDWKRTVHRKLKVENPFFENQKKFDLSSKSFASKRYDIKNLEIDYNGYLELANLTTCAFDNSFWQKEIGIFKKKKKESPKENFLSDLKISRKLLLQNWEKSLHKEYVKWELAEIEKYRQEIRKKLENWLELLQKIQDTIDSLSLGTGFLFDLSKGDISLHDINQIQKWVEYIAKNEGVKNLCDMLGRLRSIEKSTKREIVQITTTIERTVKDYTSREEIVSIKIGKDLEHVLPQEIALLGDEELSILFDKKYVEGALMCFELEGMTTEKIGQNETREEEKSEDEKMGPVIICIDTSGSMSGSPETIAKAVALYIASRAKTQKRNCFLINFSTSIEVLDLSETLGINQLIDFLGRSFHGGTDVAPAIRYAIKKINEEEYSKADLLIVSDFIMSSLPQDVEKSIFEMKKKKNKFYSLSIGNMFLENRMKEIFDGEWVYNPQNSSITQLIKMVSKMERRD